MTSGIKNYFDNNVKEIRTEGYEKNNAKYAYEFLKKSKKILYVGSGDGMMIKELLKLDFKNYSSKFNLPSDSFYRFDYILENLNYRNHKIN